MSVDAPLASPLRSSPAWNLMAGTATKYALLAVNIGLGIFLMPFTIHHLGTSEYGLWMLVASITMYFQLLDLGYGSGLVRHAATADARGDVGLVNQFLSTFVVVYSVIGLAAAASIAAIAVWILPEFPRLQPEQVADARFVLVALGIRIAVGFPMTVFGAATVARQRFALNNLVAIAVTLLNGAVTFVLLVSGYRVRAVVAGSTAVSLCSYVAYAWTARRAFPELKLRFSSFRAHLIREVTAFSLYVFLIDIAIQIGFNLDNVVIAAALGTSAVALYAVTLRLADYQRQLCNQLNGLLFPVVVRYGAVRDEEALKGLRSTMIDGTRVALTLVLGVTVCMLGFASPLIVLWMGPAFEGSVAPLYALAIAGVVLVGQGPLGSILLATDRHRLVALVALGEALANLALSVVLVRRYGILGVAIGTAVPVILANLLILVPAACRQAGLRVWTFATAVAVAPLIGALLAAFVGGALRSWWTPQSIPVVLAEAAVVGIAYLAAVWSVGFDHVVRARYGTYVRHLFASLTERRATPSS